jgi:hypothetical protein
MDNPIKKAISTSHRLAYGSNATFSHFSIAQKTTAVNSDDIA